MKSLGCFLPYIEPVTFPYLPKRKLQTQQLQILVLRQVSKRFWEIADLSLFWVEFPYLDLDELLNMKSKVTKKPKKNQLF